LPKTTNDLHKLVIYCPHTSTNFRYSNSNF